jgi:hypothetical protein
MSDDPDKKSDDTKNRLIEQLHAEASGHSPGEPPGHTKDTTLDVVKPGGTPAPKGHGESH